MKLYQKVNILARRLGRPSLEFVIIAARVVIGEGIVGNISPTRERAEFGSKEENTMSCSRL